MTLEGESDNYQWTNMHKILIPLHDMMKSISSLSLVPPEIFQMTIDEVLSTTASKPEIITNTYRFSR
ncbi:hypothetical protein GX48_03838 [Paracoccidioides brasiliensis]|nr:hypothetical protein GX48_03838 [Paracoccidioides brasiliensis]